jgi:hypothetical protein
MSIHPSYVYLSLVDSCPSSWYNLLINQKATMQPIDIEYIFKFKDKREKHVHVCLNPQTLDLIAEIPEKLPTWTDLDFHQCPNCLLSIQSTTKCPVAVHLVKLIESFEDLQSYDIILVEIMTPERITFNETSAQKGLSSLLGLIISTCGCPHTDFFKPMARFHLPFANALETTFRAASMYLIAQYLRRKHGLNADLELEGLKKIYSNIQLINVAIAERLRAITPKDAAVNALVILDIFAQSVTFSIDESLDEISHLFTSYFIQ